MQPQLFQVGDLAVPAYGFFLALALVCGLALSMRLAPRAGCEPEDVLDLSLRVIAGAMVGSHLTAILLHLPEVLAAPERALGVGHSFQGGAVGAFLASSWFARRRGLDLWVLADAVAPSLGVGLAVARIGCFLGGCCYGQICDLPWAVHLERIPGARHPAPLYEMPLDLLLAAGLAWLLPRRKVPGQVFLAFVAGYGVLRFVCEFFRDSHPMIAGFSLAQWFSLATAALAVAVHRRRLARARGAT